MSKASITGQIVVTSNGTTIYPILQCTTGDVNQNYDGEWNALLRFRLTSKLAVLGIQS